MLKHNRIENKSAKWVALGAVFALVAFAIIAISVNNAKLANADVASTVCQPGIDMQNINYTGVKDLRDDKTEPLGAQRDPHTVMNYQVSQCPNGEGMRVDSVSDYSP